MQTHPDVTLGGHHSVHGTLVNGNIERGVVELEVTDVHFVPFHRRASRPVPFAHLVDQNLRVLGDESARDFCRNKQGKERSAYVCVDDVMVPIIPHLIQEAKKGSP